MAEIFQYIKMENEERRYVCLQQSLLGLGWILSCRKDLFVPIWPSDGSAHSIRAMFREVRHKFGLFRMNVRFLLNLFCYKYRLRKSNSELKFSFFGQMCLQVHKGYKFFDFRKRVVRKVFDQDISTSTIMKEIESLRRVSGNDFAPNIKRWNLEEKWYEEDYVDGFMDSSQKPMDTPFLLEHFQWEVVPILENLMLLQKPLVKNALEYVQNVFHAKDLIENSSRHRDPKDHYEITSFVNSLIERIKSEQDYPIQLVFSHGDFVPNNMLKTNQGIKLVDWEDANFRSALYDFYSYFFYRPLFTNTAIGNLAFEINRALPLFIGGIARKAPELSISLGNSQDIYRRIFFIEMLCKLTRREMTDTRLNIRDFMSRYLEVFSRYEECFAIHIKN